MYRLLKLTGEQIRAARALARVDQSDLATRSGLSLETIKRLERIRGPVEATSRTLIALGETFAAMGVEFDEGLGVRLIPPSGAPGRVATPDSVSAEPRQGLHRLIYYSRATAEGSSADGVADIARSARSRNAAMQVTGALLVCQGYFLQLLEGDKADVLQLYGSISADRRHEALQVIESRATTVRQFPGWSLCVDRIENGWEHFAGEPAMRDGFRPELLTAVSACGLLAIMGDLQLARTSKPRSRSQAA